MEKLLDYKFVKHEKCPACMIRKSKRQNDPGQARRVIVSIPDFPAKLQDFPQKLPDFSANTPMFARIF